MTVAAVLPWVLIFLLVGLAAVRFLRGKRPETPEEAHKRMVDELFAKAVERDLEILSESDRKHHQRVEEVIQNTEQLHKDIGALRDHVIELTREESKIQARRRSNSHVN